MAQHRPSAFDHTLLMRAPQPEPTHAQPMAEQRAEPMVEQAVTSRQTAPPPAIEYVAEPAYAYAPAAQQPVATMASQMQTRSVSDLLRMGPASKVGIWSIVSSSRPKRAMSGKELADRPFAGQSGSLAKEHHREMKERIHPGVAVSPHQRAGAPRGAGQDAAARALPSRL